MVSVLMPVYNAAATLPHALASVRRQSLAEWELVAVDDGSTDGSGELLDAFADGESRCRVLHRPHRGLVPALNDGLGDVRGAWLARFDADDLMHRDRLLRQRGAACDGVLGCAVRSFPVGSIGEGFQRYEAWLNGLLTHEQIERDLFVESPLAHPSVMLPTRLLRAVGGYRDLGWPEDYDLWLRLWAAGARFRKLPEVLLYWRDHPGRLSRGGGAYGTAAFRRCKVAHLKATRLRGVDTVIVWGAGKGGRYWSRTLTAAGLRVALHIDPDKAGGAVRGAPVEPPEMLRGGAPHPVLVTVGVLGAREMIRARLDGFGLTEGEDYVCVA